MREERFSPYFVPAKSPQKSLPNKMGFCSPKGTSEKKKLSSKERLRRPDKKLGGLTEKDVKKLLLPDHLAPHLDIIFVGTNPGLISAYKGHHYSNSTNHFWPLLFDSGLVGKRLTWQEDYKCLEYGIGLTNIVARATRGAAELSRSEIKSAKDSLIKVIGRLKPLVVCFNGKGMYEIFSGKKCEVGRQESIYKSAVYVMPSTSGLVARYPRKEDKLIFFQQLKLLRDQMKSENLEDDISRQQLSLVTNEDFTRKYV